MGSTHAHAPWRKTVLIPFWTIQLGLELLYVAILALSIGVLVTWQKNHDECDGSESRYSTCQYDWSEVSTASKIVVPIWLVMLLICLILTITEIILLARHKLKPKTFVIMNTIKCTIWTVLFVLDIIAYVDNNSRTTSIVALAIEVILWLCFLIPLIYGARIYHRSRHTRYAPVSDPTDPTRNSLLPDAVPTMPTAYTGYAVKAYANRDTDMEAQQPPAADGYNHQRDTRFEEFRRTSYGEQGFTPYSEQDIGYRGAAGVSVASPDLRKGSPEVPQVYVQHHDGEAFEMESSRRDLR